MSAAKNEPVDDSAAEPSPPLVSVLVVDNDLAHARTMAEVLERLGYRCVVAGGGREGAERIANEVFDVDTAVSEGAAFAIRLGDHCLECDYALKSGNDLTH